jgi:hypothetical protein
MGNGSFGFITQGSNASTVNFSHMWAENNENTPTEWWIFIVLIIDESYWKDIESYSLTIEIEDQTKEMIPDPMYQKANSDEQGFITRFSNLQPGNYYVLLQWSDDITVKIWTDENIRLGNQTSVERFHEIAPGILMVAILALIVIFPGQEKETIQSKQSEDL